MLSVSNQHVTVMKESMLIYMEYANTVQTIESPMSGKLDAYHLIVLYKEYYRMVHVKNVTHTKEVQGRSMKSVFKLFVKTIKYLH